MITSCHPIPGPAEFGADAPRNIGLDYTGRYYPMGFPLDLATNSPDVIRAADGLWSGNRPAPAAAGVSAPVLHLAVDPADSLSPVRPSTPKAQRHLVSFIHSAENFAISDLSAGFAWGRLTRDVASDLAYVSYHFLEPVACLMIEALYLTPLHASCIAHDGKALLLCGDSGAGKNSLAYHCARAGWTYLSDDATHVVRSGSGYTVVGRPRRIRFRAVSRSLFPELNAHAPFVRPNGKLDIEVNTSQLGVGVTEQSEAIQIVFLQRESGLQTVKVSGVARTEALRRLAGTISSADERVRSEQMDALRRFTELPAQQLTYGTLGSAESALRTLTC
jgi:hypothetical protein